MRAELEARVKVMIQSEDQCQAWRTPQERKGEAATDQPGQLGPGEVHQTQCCWSIPQFMYWEAILFTTVLTKLSVVKDQIFVFSF